MLIYVRSVTNSHYLILCMTGPGFPGPILIPSQDGMRPGPGPICMKQNRDQDLDFAAGLKLRSIFMR